MTDNTSDDWYDPDATTFGDRLAGARDAAGLDVPELARRLGVKTRTLRAWEEDRSEPRANRISMLAGILNVSLRWLMTGDGEGPSTAPPAASADGDLLRDIARARAEAARLTQQLSSLEGRLRAQLGR